MKGIYIPDIEMPKYLQRAEIGIDTEGNGVLFVYTKGVKDPDVYDIKPLSELRLKLEKVFDNG